MSVRPFATAVLLLALLLAAACRTPPAPPPIPPGTLVQAAAPQPPPQDDDWNWRFAPYLWAAGLDGDITVRNTTAHFSVPFSDILEDLNYAVMGTLEAQKGQWAVLLDNAYISLSDDSKAHPGPGPGFDVDADAALLISELAGLYRIAPGSPYEVGAGVRYTDLRTDVHIASAPGLHDDDSVTDGVAVGRATWPLSERWHFRLFADAGTGDSDFTWQTAATFLYDCDGWQLGAGYRILDYDIGGSHDANFTLEGFTFGADFRF
jgi:hypothetical protein